LDFSAAGHSTSVRNVAEQPAAIRFPVQESQLLGIPVVVDVANMAAVRRVRALVLCLLCLTTRAYAQVDGLSAAADNPASAPGEPAAASKIGKTLHARRLTTAPPRIDGTLDDTPWSPDQESGDLVQWEPDNMAPLSERTTMQVLYDHRYLYVAVRCFDRSPSEIARGMGRRDDNPPTDTISLGFDPRHDHQTGYTFQTNASGVQTDAYMYDDDHSDSDYDAVWEVRTSITAEGWTAEFRIPFSQMRFNSLPSPGQVWGFTVRRAIRRRAEYGEWTGRPRGERGEVSRWGHLVFDDELTPPRRRELQPYVLASSTRPAANAAADFAGSAGVDLRLGIGSATTLSATLNPDFGQVEQDPAVLNLSVFETFFPEKRPFFLEDSRTFVPPYNLFQLFHSRRIGRTPDHFETPTGEDVTERPAQTSVLGAAKLTSKGAGWTYGALTAVTGREHARLASGRDVLIEPATSYSVARVQRDVLGGSSNVGGIFTATVHEKDADAYTGGFDYNLRWDRNRATWNGHWAFTHAPGQRGVATSGGGLTSVNISHKHYGFAGHFDHFGRDFRVNDLGFFRTRANRTEIDGNAWVEQPDPWKGFRRLSAGLFAARSWNDNALVLTHYVGGYTSTQFRSFWNIDTEFGRNFQVFDDLDTRGGPPILVPARPFFNMYVNSDSRKSWRLFVLMQTQRDVEGGWSARFGPSLTVQPSGRLQAGLSTNYTVARDIAQWIKNTDTNGDGVDDNVYGTLRRNVLDITVRSTFAMQRDLTLQVFLQPFVAVGAYSDIRRLARPMSFDFDAAVLPDNPDFNNKSFRSNVVLRWEYVRGSTLYLVWNASKSDAARPGMFSPIRDIGDTFRGDGPSVFMVKLSYWLSR
jgi:hypothetical protein